MFAIIQNSHVCGSVFPQSPRGEAIQEDQEEQRDSKDQGGSPVTGGQFKFLMSVRFAFYVSVPPATSPWHFLWDYHLSILICLAGQWPLRHPSLPLSGVTPALGDTPAPRLGWEGGQPQR